MKYFLGAAALLAASANAQYGSDGCTNDGGNSYCKLVDAISYTGVGGAGSYNKVTNMDSNSGSCSSSPYGYSGSLSPMNEEISIHIRGPTILKRFAAYTPGSASSKKKRDAQQPERRHAHGHAHQHLHKQHQERAVGDMVVATIDGVVQSWANAYDGGASSPATAAAAAPAYNTPPAHHSGHGAPAGSSGSSSSSDSSNSSDDSGAVINPAGPGSWGRHAMYDGDNDVSEGLVFLNHEGGSGSGTFDYKFGNSLSYASADGCSGSKTPQALAKDTLLPSTAEVIIMTDDKCNGDDCGYYRPDTVAYHGFDGDDKAFFFEFQMPDSGEGSAGQYTPVNMPAIWSLNAQIPRTLQYGNEECSCWQSGCGEFDIFEVLAAGDARMKSTMHGNKAGGSSDYFWRPFNQPVIGAMIMMNNQIHVKMLSNDTTFDFPATMDKSDFNQILTGASQNGLGNALFSLADALSG